MNGITGLKPSWGRVSRAGVFALAKSMDHIGPMARSATDAAAMLGLSPAPIQRIRPLAGTVPDYLAGIGEGVRGLPLGIDRALIAAGSDADMVRATEEAAAVLTRLGALPRDVSFPSLDAVVRDWMSLCGVEAAVAHEATYPSRAAEYGPVLAGLLETAAASRPRRDQNLASPGGVPRPARRPFPRYRPAHHAGHGTCHIDPGSPGGSWSRAGSS